MDNIHILSVRSVTNQPWGLGTTGIDQIVSFQLNAVIGNYVYMLTWLTSAIGARWH